MGSNIEEPFVKPSVIPVEPVKYRTGDSINLPSFEGQLTGSFIEILEGRESRRAFESISLARLGPLFYLTSRTRFSEVGSHGLRIEKRNAPSCGALHTIDCIVTNFNNDEWYLYNPRSHSLDEIVVNKEIVVPFKIMCQQVLQSEHGYLIWYVCDIDTLCSKYENAESLALRESGALSATQGLVAESLGMAFCMLGLLGYQSANGLSDHRNLIGVGTACVGGVSMA